MNIYETKTDEDLRKKLDFYGIKYSRSVVELSSLDDEDNEYQTRASTTCNKEHVERCQAGIEAGHLFPEFVVVCGYSKKSKKKLCTGRHRTKALKKSGYDAVWAIVVEATTDNDREKLRGLSSWDNQRNGLPEDTVHVYMQIAEQCIRRSGGYESGLPSQPVIDSVCVQHDVPPKRRAHVRSHIKTLLFQHHCRALQLGTVPSNVSLCSNAYDLLERAGGDDIARAVCLHGKHKSIVDAVKRCKTARFSGEKAVAYIQDACLGFVAKDDGMRAEARLRRAIRSVLDSAEKFASDASASIHEVEKVEKALSKAVADVHFCLSQMKGRLGDA